LGGTSASTITLSGGGTLALDNRVQNRIFSTATNTLVNSAGNTIQGSGQFGIGGGGAFTLNNQGLINANQSSALQINTGTTTTNTATLEATSGGTLNLVGAYTNTGGNILATGTNSVVNLNGSTITGGTLTTASGGVIENNGTATLNGVTIPAGSTLTLADNTITTVQGTITNHGTIAQNSAGNNTDPPSSHLFIQIGGPDTLHGLSQLDISGTANLNNGTLSLCLTNGFVPTNGEFFPILTSGGLSGTFNDNSIQVGNVTFNVEYSPPGFANDVVLQAIVNGSAVPEPASWLMVTIAGALVGGMVYRRRRSL
jgi:hypothetical protein